MAENNLQLLTDEQLVTQCRDGIELAERELLGRYMPAIYWLPHRILGVPEEELSGFLLFALEKIRERDILSKFEPTRGAKFGTWLSVVVRNLYLDYLRARPDEPPTQDLPSQILDEKFLAPERKEERAELLKNMQIKCRVTFKLLLCDSFQLTPEELQFLAQESGRDLVETSREVAKMEERLQADEARISGRYDKLSRAYYWKSFYARQIAELEKQSERPHTTPPPRLEKLRRFFDRRQSEYDEIAFELSGIGGIVTTPYKELARLMKSPEGTLASNISRCRSGAADLLRRLRSPTAQK